MALVTFGEALLMWQVNALPSAVALREIQMLDVSLVLSMFQDPGKMALPGVQAGLQPGLDDMRTFFLTLLPARVVQSSVF